MVSLFTKFSRFFARFRRKDDGSATIEFVLVFPAFMVLFLSAFEAGLLMTRNVMLERGLDMAVRTVRLGTASPVNNDQMKRMICTGAGIIPDCLQQLRVEMRRVDLRAWTDIPVRANCQDRNDPAKPLATFVTGGANDVMVVRACALFDPFFPGTGLGFQLPRESGGAYALVSTSAFVMEPL